MIPQAKAGFSAINGEICEVRIKVVNFRTNASGLPSDLLVSHAGGDSVVSADNFFDSIEHLTEQKPEPWNCPVYTPHFFQEKLKDNFDVDCWVMENGLAVHKTGPAMEILISIGEKGNVAAMESPQIPSESYDSSEQCYAFNDVTVVAADGSRRVVKGIANLCRLTPEQEQIMQDIEALFDKAHASGLKIVQDFCGTYAFNVSDLQSWEFGYENIDGMEFVDLSNPMFHRERPLSYVTSDDDRLFVCRKES